MIAIQKSELIPLIIKDYRRQLQESAYELYHFQHKYKCSFFDFEKQIKNQDQEDFDQWDDYISWKGHLKSAEHLSEKMEKIEHGLFEVA